MTLLTSEANYWAIVPAAGVGSRMLSTTPKQYLTLHNKPVIHYALQTLLDNPRIAKIVVAIHPQDNYWASLAIAQHPKILTTKGGVDRASSVLNSLRALKAYANSADWILVHDAARPCLMQTDLERLMQHLSGHAIGGILGYRARDTLKQVTQNGEITRTLEREGLWHALTPQMFRYQLLTEALENAFAQAISVTDEASALELAGFKPAVIEGRADNIKLTCPEDLKLAEFFLGNQQ